MQCEKCKKEYANHDGIYVVLFSTDEKVYLCGQCMISLYDLFKKSMAYPLISTVIDVFKPEIKDHIEKIFNSLRKMPGYVDGV